MARWFGEWHGGANYAPPDGRRELFLSQREAMAALLERYASNGQYRCTFRWVDLATSTAPETTDYVPNVDASSEILLYASPDPERDDYPSRRVFLGPRGAARVERCG